MNYLRQMTGAAAAAMILGLALAAGCSGDTGGTNDAGGDATVAGCGANSTLCGGVCVSTANDNANCGACANACGAGTVCSQGKCGTSCGGGTKLCGSSCADTQVDPANCGACGTKCAGGQVCSGGTCGSTCAAGQTLCGADAGAPYCASTKTDNANCGTCGVACGAGQVCQNGACANSCASADGGVEALCTPDGGAPYCASTDSDNQNCGACGVVCPGGTLCDKGACTNSCPSEDGGTLTLCNADGGVPYCTDTSSDPNNCGACGASCGTAACVGGACNTCSWNVASYTWPITVHPSNYFGAIRFDGNCNILVSGGYNANLYSVSKTNGAVSTAVTGFSGSTAVNGIVYRPSDDTVYVATDLSPQLFKIVNGASVLVMALPAIINDIALAPPGFGAYGDQLIGASYDGNVYAIDPVAKTATSIGSTSGILSSVVMAPDGSVAYLANNGGGKVQTMTAAGTFADLVTGLTSVDGLAIDGSGASLYATVNYDAIDKIDIANKSAASYVPTIALDNGYYVTGMIVDGQGHLIVKTSVSANAVLNHY